MPAYRHLFFDLDHTLWDFDRCSGETLEELFHEHRMDALGVSGADTFVSTFRTINRDLWNQYGAGQITQQQLRDTRFALVLGQLGLPRTDIEAALAEQYMQRCSRKPHLRPYAREVLDYLRHKYELHILDYALQRAGARLHHSLMIGDSLEADVVGARNAGMDHVFYNCDGLTHTETPTYEITCLSELLNIL
jgi:putative hydrolase of the HAD superfamily